VCLSFAFAVLSKWRKLSGEATDFCSSILPKREEFSLGSRLGKDEQSAEGSYFRYFG